MATTNFTDQVTVVEASWLNDVDEITYPSASKTSAHNNDEFILRDSQASYVPKKYTYTNFKADVWAFFGSLIAAGTSKTTPVDADSIALCDSAASNATKKLTWANLKANVYTAGTYSPTLAGGGAATTPLNQGVWSYFRIGNIVTVYGAFSVIFSSAATGSVSITLPIASTFTAESDIVGTGGQLDGMTNWVVRNNTTSAIAVSSIPNITGSSVVQYVHFSYTVK